MAHHPDTWPVSVLCEVWESLAKWLDWYARMVVGWVMQSQIDAPLVQATWRMARGYRRPAAGLMQHAEVVSLIY